MNYEPYNYRGGGGAASKSPGAQARYVAVVTDPQAFECDMCGWLRPFNMKHNEANGVTLCTPCHMKTLDHESR